MKVEKIIRCHTCGEVLVISGNQHSVMYEDGSQLYCNSCKIEILAAKKKLLEIKKK